MSTYYFYNADNFYSRNFVKKTLPRRKAEIDIHHFKPEYQEAIDAKKKIVPEIVDNGTEKCTPSRIER
jgi:hypothetical protein